MKSNTPRLDALIARVAEYCEAERGRQSALIKYLDVKPPRLSEWLKGVRKPNGETALAMQEWLAAQTTETLE